MDTRDPSVPSVATPVQSTSSSYSRQPLLPRHKRTTQSRRSFSPFWLVPFVITASIVRAMTVAPRVEIFNRLSCNSKYDARNSISPHSLYQSSLPDQPSYPDTSILPPLRFTSASLPSTNNLHWRSSHKCISDPSVQKRTSRLQMIVTTIGGALSALSTGYWSRHGERHGRTKVLAIATFGLLSADIISLLAYSPRSLISVHGYKLIFLAPFVEGISGGWSTLYTAVIMYISDRTTSQSHGQVLSKYQSLFYLGFILGPALGAWLIRHPFVNITEMEKSPADGVTSVFCIAIACSLVNLFLTLFLSPESSVPAKRKANRSVSVGEEPPNTAEVGGVSKDVIAHFRSHMSVFMPKRYLVMNRLQVDWSLTVLGCMLFGYLLSTAVLQVRYLYAEHVYGWDVGQLSIFIFVLGAARAVYYLFISPLITWIFKPKPKPKSAPSPYGTGTANKSVKPTKAHLLREIRFDLFLTRLSLFLDLLSHVLVTLAPVPSSSHRAFIRDVEIGSDVHLNAQAQVEFVFASALSAGAGDAVPAVHNLALCLLRLQMRSGASGTSDGDSESETVRKLFGALGIVTAVSQMVLGPVIFGITYGETVFAYPKAAFVLAGGLVLSCLIMSYTIQPPRGRRGRANQKRWREDVDEERGRSRVSKDLRGGAAPWTADC